MPNYIIRFKSKESFDTCCQNLHSKKQKHKKIDLLQSISLSLKDRIENQSIDPSLIDPTLIERIDEDITIDLIRDKEVAPSATSISSVASVPWGVQRIGAKYSRIPKQYTRPRVAILDTGLSRHPSIRIAPTYVNFSDEASALDQNGHGTHIAGTVGGYTSSRTKKDTSFHGVFPEMPLAAVKAFDKEGSASLSSILQSIDWCVRHKIKIINMSFGLEKHHETLYEAIRLAHQQGILMVAASGNEGKPGLQYPARYPEVISVGSIDRQGNISDFSQYGTSLDIVAPGSEIYSTWIRKTYKTISGTSMACAHVTGALALILSINPSLSPTAARRILLQNTEALSATFLLQGNGLVSVPKIISSLKKES
jgi:subtilisin